MPFGISGIMNMTRPAVLRTYFGRNIELISPTKWERVTYGSTDPHGTISMDPRRYNTKAMCEEMHYGGNILKEIAMNLNMILKYNNKQKNII